MNAFIVLYMLHLIEAKSKNFNCGMSIKLKKEFIFLLTDRQITSENLYFFLQALCQENLSSNKTKIEG